jgi:hypothetical protein
VFVASPVQSSQSMQPTAAWSSAASTDQDVFATIEKLAGLRAKGILTEDEFQAKKAELLARL